MPKIVIFGSVGVNRGDDLMTRVLVNACRKCGYYPVVASMNPQFIERTYDQDSFHSSRLGFRRWMTELFRAECVIVGGGTLIQNDFGRSRISGILLYAVAAIVFAKVVFAKPTYVLGVGINKVSFFNRFLAKFFRLADLIVVRDRASVDNARLLGITKNVVELFDIGLCKSLYDDPKRFVQVRRPAERGLPYICLSLAKEGNAQQAMVLAQGVLVQAARSGRDVVLVAMNVSESEELSLYAEIVRTNELPVDVSIFVPDTPYEVAELVRHAEACVGMRLHFCVLCLVNGICPVIVSREQKSEWMRAYVGDDRFIQHSDPALASRVMGLLDDPMGHRLSPAVVAELERVDRIIEITLGEVLSGQLLTHACDVR